MKSKRKLVLDTNIIISSWFGNLNSPSKEIIMLWEYEKILLMYSNDIINEYINKLKFKNVPDKHIIAFIENIYDSAIYIEIEFFHLHNYPKDQDDVAFVLCADNGSADYLISYDNHLLILNGCYSFKVCNSLDFLFEYRLF